MQDAKTSPLDGSGSQISRRLKWLASIVIVTVFLILLADPDDLVDRVPIGYAITTGFLGVGGGLYADFRLQRRLKEKGWRGYVAMAVLPFIMLLIASSLGRLAFEAVAFTGVTPTETTAQALIVSMANGKSGPHAVVKITPNSREVRVAVTGDLYAQLDAYRHPGRDCLALVVQTGRFGVRRALIPAPLSTGLGSERFHPCPATVATWASIGDGG